MPADVVGSRELKSLQEELSASQRDRLAAPEADCSKGQDRGSRRADSVAGVRGLELRNPGTSHVFEIL